MDLTKILDECLERLANGESAAECLARYPEAARQLAPMLQAAEQLHTLRQARLSEGQRLRAKVALREELAQRQAERERGLGFAGGLRWLRTGLAPVVALLVAVLFVGAAFSTVAASHPGDPAYAVRVALERASVWVQLDAGRRAAAELALADRRLSDITGNTAGDAIAVDALLRSHTAAVDEAQGLSEAEQTAVKQRLAAHAAELDRLARLASDAAIARRLQNAAARAEDLLARVRPVAPTPIVIFTATVSPTLTAGPIFAPPTVVVPTVNVPTITVPTVTVPTITVSPIPTIVVHTPAASVTPRPRPRLTLTRPLASRTPLAPRPRNTMPAPIATVIAGPTVPVQPPVISTPVPPPTVILPDPVVPTPVVGTPIVPEIPPTRELPPIPTGVVDPRIPPTPDLNILPTGQIPIPTRAHRIIETATAVAGATTVAPELGITPPAPRPGPGGQQGLP